MRKTFVTLMALLATAGMIWAVFLPGRDMNETPSSAPSLVGVWVVEQELPLWSWLRKEARQFEKETGTRVYLRAAPKDCTNMSAGEEGPDLLISGQGDRRIALQGFALFFRDDTAHAVTPHPTSLLFFQPSPSPGPAPTLGPTPDIARFSLVLTPEKLLSSIPGGIHSENPFQDLIDVKGDAAVLTVEQAKELPFRVGMHALDKQKGFLPVCGSASTPAGEAFLSFLMSEKGQRALTEAGLFSPFYSLYRGADPLREMIENER